jgi:hypothetical protein
VVNESRIGSKLRNLRASECAGNIEIVKVNNKTRKGDPFYQYEGNVKRTIIGQLRYVYYVKESDSPGEKSHDL